MIYETKLNSSIIHRLWVHNFHFSTFDPCRPRPLSYFSPTNKCFEGWWPLCAQRIHVYKQISFLHLSSLDLFISCNARVFGAHWARKNRDTKRMKGIRRGRKVEWMYFNSFRVDDWMLTNITMNGRQFYASNRELLHTLNVQFEHTPQDQF